MSSNGKIRPTQKKKPATTTTITKSKQPAVKPAAPTPPPQSDEDDNDEDDAMSPAAPKTVVKESGNEIIIEDNDEDNHGAEGAWDDEHATTFADLGLCEELLQACEELGWKKPSHIQRQAIPIALKNRDIIGLAETGSGKTAAFALPCLNALLDDPQPHFGLVLAPTRELAFQISETFEKLGKSIGLRVVTIVGGVNEFDQARALVSNPHIIVATPGRIVYHLEHTKGFHLKKLQYLILDEADRLLNMDFEEEINQILDILPKERRSMLFSATMTSKVNKLQRASLVDPVKIEVSKKYQTAKNLIQQFVFCPAIYKEIYLAYVLTELQGKTAIVFTATCDASQKLALILRHLGFGAIPLHGKLSQKHRLAALQRFKAGERNILIATDVAARGLDIPAVDLVINYQVPNHSKDYIHRVGRTARAGRAGRAITFVTQYDVEIYQRIEELLGYKLEQYPIEKTQALVLSQKVNEAARVAAIEMKDAENDGKKIIGSGDKKKGGGQRKK